MTGCAANTVATEPPSLADPFYNSSSLFNISATCHVTHRAFCSIAPRARKVALVVERDPHLAFGGNPALCYQNRCQVGSIATGCVAVWLTSRLGRKARADALAAKAYEAKLKGYEAIALPLEEAYLSIMREIWKFVPPSDVPLKTFWRLREVEIPFAHLFSNRVKEGIKALYDLHKDLYAKPESLHGKAGADRVNEMITEIRRAIREDCHTDPIAKHVKEVLDPDPSFLLRIWQASQAETDAVKEIGPGSSDR